MDSPDQADARARAHCRVERLGPRGSAPDAAAGNGLSLTLRADPPPADLATLARVDAEWNRLRQTNDSIFDGPILCVVGFDSATARIDLAPSTFKHLITAPALGRSVRQLGVTGWITSRSRDGREHVLLARRSSATRIYQGLWENAPSGGVPPRFLQAQIRPAPASAVPLSVHSRIFLLFDALREEAEEELGLALPTWPVAAPGLTRWIVDDLAQSLDLVFEIDADRLNRPAGTLPACEARSHLCLASRTDSAEYLDAAWVARSEISAFSAPSPSPLSPPTLALARSFGWLA